MGLEIPTTKREEIREQKHEKMERLHERDIQENERHLGDHPDHAHETRFSVGEKDRIGHDEKAVRRVQDEKDASIKEACNTELRTEEGFVDG